MKNEIRTVVLFNYREQNFANLVSKNGARIHMSQVILPHIFVRLLAYVIDVCVKTKTTFLIDCVRSGEG